MFVMATPEEFDAAAQSAVIPQKHDASCLDGRNCVRCAAVATEASRLATLRVRRGACGSLIDEIEAVKDELAATRVELRELRDAVAAFQAGRERDPGAYARYEHWLRDRVAKPSAK